MSRLLFCSLVLIMFAAGACESTATKTQADTKTPGEANGGPTPNKTTETTPAMGKDNDAPATKGQDKPDPVESKGEVKSEPQKPAVKPEAVEGDEEKALPAKSAEPKPAEKVIVEVPVEVVKEVQMRPMVMPEIRSEMWKELVDSASFETILEMLNDKARATGEKLPVAQQMALISTYLALFIGDRIKYATFLDAADALFDELRNATNVDEQWRLQTSALIGLWRGSELDAERAASALHDAYLNALHSVPLQIRKFYHCIGVREPNTGFYEMRMLSKEKRENKVYRAGDSMQICVLFSYLNGDFDKEKELWNYVVTASAELYEKDDTAALSLGPRVKEFRPRDLRNSFNSTHAPDAREVLHLRYPLPADIKSEMDYVLVLTIGDGKREGETEKVYLDVKIRHELPD